MKGTSYTEKGLPFYCYLLVIFFSSSLAAVAYDDDYDDEEDSEEGEEMEEEAEGADEWSPSLGNGNTPLRNAWVKPKSRSFMSVAGCTAAVKILVLYIRSLIFVARNASLWHTYAPVCF